jgi:hypothetical protein
MEAILLRHRAPRQRPRGVRPKAAQKTAAANDASAVKKTG